MRNLVRRYVTEEQRKADNQGVTEDDVNEIKQDISSFRYELTEILQNSGFNTSASKGQTQINLEVKAQDFSGHPVDRSKNEIKQDISSFRYELTEILQNSGFNTSASKGQTQSKTLSTLLTERHFT
ncbi:Transient receptor potential-gamma protein [Araneus ventricosus]|uniref:Transient receptor potential-gamma protein n=1 Tax=Araneus ventricosus TaxID=182803 RepID=A0A4Y2GD12_ARAVE|nr:Transient receptor potential-gamma protein [Araneus ventricosus]